MPDHYGFGQRSRVIPQKLRTTKAHNNAHTLCITKTCISLKPAQKGVKAMARLSLYSLSDECVHA